MYRIIFNSSSTVTTKSILFSFSPIPHMKGWNLMFAKSYLGISTGILQMNWSLFLKVNLRNFLSLFSRTYFLTSMTKPYWSYFSKTLIKFLKNISVFSKATEIISYPSLKEHNFSLVSSCTPNETMIGFFSESISNLRFFVLVKWIRYTLGNYSPFDSSSLKMV